MVEHYLDMVGVVGSSPIRATIFSYLSCFSIPRIFAKFTQSFFTIFFTHNILPMLYNKKSKKIVIHKQKAIILIAVCLTFLRKGFDREFG